MAGSERAQPHRREQARFDHAQDRRRAFGVEQLERQRQREDLVRSHAIVDLCGPRALALIDAVVETTGRGIPEELGESMPRALGGGLELRGITLATEATAQRGQDRSALYQSAWISTGLPRRGVMTRSPTRASIQVSCTPASPA